MLVLDASSLVAILEDEPDADVYARRIWASSGSALMPITQAFEATMSIGVRRADFPAALKAVETYLREAGITTIECPADGLADLVKIYSRYGKKTGHPAKLNFGDCFAYLMARRTGLPLLYKGEDFVHTDIKSAA